VTTWRYAASTDVGLVRDVNEDALHADSILAVVADGMGGAAAGEVASKIAVAQIVQGFGADATSHGLVQAMVSANREILADAKSHPEHTGMGTTAVAVGLTTVVGGVLPVVVNIGDSRCYQLRDGALRQITNDHSVAEEWVRQGRLTSEEAATHPRRHQLTRTLGVDTEVEPDVFPLAVERGDRILLCSDGLSNELSDDELAAIASAPRSLDEAVASLVEMANARGGRDNITVVLLEFVDETAQPTVGETSAAPVISRDRTVGAREDAAAVAVPGPTRPRTTRQRRVTWRTVVFCVALAALVAGAYAVMDWYEHSDYYLADRGGKIAIYQGQPHGFLWFKPIFVSDTEYEAKQLQSSAYQSLLSLQIVEPTLTAAMRQAKLLHYLWRLSQPVTTTTTTTTLPLGTT
jgi:PPM family protein phosphatase